MNTKQLTYPTIKEQEQYWIDKEAEPNNAATETREDYQCVFILGSPDTPHLCYQCGKPRLSHGEQSTTGDPKPEDIGGNHLPDRIEANEDWYERNDFDRGDLRDEGRNPDGSGESFSERNR